MSPKRVTDCVRAVAAAEQDLQVIWSGGRAVLPADGWAEAEQVLVVLIPDDPEYRLHRLRKAKLP